MYTEVSASSTMVTSTEAAEPVPISKLTNAFF